MLGALSLKWKWRQRREAAGKDTDEAEPGLRRRRARGLGEVLPLLRRRAADRPAAARQVHDRPRGRRASHRREHDRRRRRARHDLHRPRRRHHRHQRPTSSRSSTTRGIDVPLHIDGASGGFVWPFLYPDSEWDFRLEQVRSINVSGHKFGLVYPGIGWLIFRETVRPRRGPRLLRELPRQDRRDLHAQLLDRLVDGARPVLQPDPLRPTAATAT